MGFIIAPTSGGYILGLSSGVGGIDSLWIGLNEYAAHLDEVGSIDYRPF